MLLDTVRVIDVVYVFTTSVIVFWIVRFVLRKSRHSLPPGPKGLPFLGYFAPLSHMTLWNHADLYGKISGYHVMGVDIVSLNSIEAIRDAFQSPQTAEVFGARNPTFFKCMMYDDVVLRSMHEHHWKAQRGVLHATLKAYGDGITEIEHVVSEELEHVKDLLYSRVGKDADLDDYLAPSILNIIYTLLNGERYAYDDFKIETVLEGNRLGNYLAKPLIDTALRKIPFLTLLPFGIGKTFRFVNKASQVFLDVAFEQCRRMPIEERKHRKGISFELLRQIENSDWLTLNLARGCVQDVGGAGNLTTRNSLYTLFLILMHHPEVQKKIQDEIDIHIGSHRAPTLADRKNMPYTLSAILELTRYGSNVALSVPHACTQRTEFRGVVVPRDAVIIPNLFRVHHDDKLWDNPWLFDPSRFLDEKGELLPATHERRRNLIAFGVGKRMCMGEAFAKTRIFLYVTSLLQCFTFSPSGVLPSCDPRTFETDVVIHPAPYRVKVELR